MKIIVDAMGGDNAPQAPVMGAVQANREYGVDIILVGRGEAILKVLEENGIQELPAGVEIAHASEVVEMCDNPATAFREKKDSSLTVGLNLLKDGERGRLCLRRLHRRPAGRGHPAGQAHQGHPPGGPGPCGAHGERRRGAHRLRRQRRVSAGVSDPVRLYGLLLRRARAGPPGAPGGPAEHRRGALQGH